jgi:hypothetical protein
VKWLVDHENRSGFTFNEQYSFRELLEKANSLPDSHFKELDYFCQSENGSCGV